MESNVMTVRIDNKEPATTVAAFHAIAEIMYRNKRTFTIRSTNLPTGDVDIHYHGFEKEKGGEIVEVDASVLGEAKTVSDILSSRGKRFTDQKQRLSNIEKPTIFVLRGWWGDPRFTCGNCGHKNAFILCPSCKKPNKYRDSAISPSDSKSIATMLVEMMKLGMPAFSVPDDMMMAYVFFKYLDIKGDALTRYRIVSNFGKKIEATYLAALGVKGTGEAFAMGIANAVHCPNEIGTLSIDDLTTILKSTRRTVAENRKKPYQQAIDFYNEWHGIVT